MQLFHRYHSHKMYKLFCTDFWRFELSVWLNVFGRAMISIFIPIFLLKIGFSITGVLLYYLIFNLFDWPLNFVAKWAIQKIGARKVVMIGTISFIIFFGILYNLQLGNWYLFVIMAFFLALYDTFYWVGHLYLFMLTSKHKKNISGDTSFLYIVKKIAGVLAPMIGALILIFLHRNILIITSMVILSLSIWPLYKFKNIKDKPEKEKVFDSKKFFSNIQDTKSFITMAFYGLHNVAEDVIWPIFIFTLFNSLESVAIIPILVSVSSIILTYFTGKVKKSNRARVTSLAALLVTVTWILRIVLSSNIFYYLSVVLVGFFSVLITLPTDSDIFELGERKDPLFASTYRNFISMFPRIFLYAFLIILLEVFKISFVVAAVSMFLLALFNYIFIPKKPVVVVKNV